MKTYHKTWNGEKWTISCEDDMEILFDENENIIGAEILTVEPAERCDISIGFHSNL